MLHRYLKGLSGADRDRSSRIQTHSIQTSITTKYLILKRLHRRRTSKICTTRSVMSTIRIAQEACTRTNSRRSMWPMRSSQTKKSERRTMRQGKRFSLAKANKNHNSLSRAKAVASTAATRAKVARISGNTSRNQSMIIIRGRKPLTIGSSHNRKQRGNGII